MKTGKLYAYRINPIDFGWENVRSADNHRKRLATSFAEEKDPYERAERLKAVSAFEDFSTAAIKAGKQAGWEGDYRIEPHVGFLPVENEFAIYLVWKQDNNGDTFVVSPLELPWLDELSY